MVAAVVDVAAGAVVAEGAGPDAASNKNGTRTGSRSFIAPFAAQRERIRGRRMRRNKNAHDDRPDADHRERGKERRRCRRDHSIGRRLIGGDRGERRSRFPVRRSRERRTNARISGARRRCGVVADATRPRGVSRCDVGGVGHDRERRWGADSSGGRRSCKRAGVVEWNHGRDESREQTTANGVGNPAAFRTGGRALAFVLRVQIRGGHQENGDRENDMNPGPRNKMHQDLGMCIGVFQPRPYLQSFQHGHETIHVKDYFHAGHNYHFLSDRSSVRCNTF